MRGSGAPLLATGRDAFNAGWAALLAEEVNGLPW
jgi:hypothetical protein